ncbi:hypothetical protein MBLNU457_3634t1 [Dothideomycetes sp. NU457]
MAADMPEEYDFDVIRQNDGLLGLFYCLYPSSYVHQHMPDVCGAGGHLLTGFKRLQDRDAAQYFRLFYQNRFKIKDILAQCQWLKSPSAMSSDTNINATSKKPARTARVAKTAGPEAHPILLRDDDDDDDSTTSPSNRDSHGSESPVSATEDTPPPVQEKKKKKKNKKAKKDKSANTLPNCADGDAANPQESTGEQERVPVHPDRRHMIGLDANDSFGRDGPSESASPATRAEHSAPQMTPESSREGPVALYSASTTPRAPSGWGRNGHGGRDFDPRTPRYGPRASTFPNQKSWSLRDGRRDWDYRDRSVDYSRPPPPKHFNRSRSSGGQNNTYVFKFQQTPTHNTHNRDW